MVRLLQKLANLCQGLKRGDTDSGSGGLVVSAHFHHQFNYSVFESVAFDNIKNTVYGGGESVTFQSDGDFAFYVFDHGGDSLERNTAEFMDRVLKEDFEVPTKSRQAVMALFLQNLASFRRDAAANG